MSPVLKLYSALICYIDDHFLHTHPNTPFLTTK